MVTERRQSPRATPYEPVYISFPNQNRGVVIDACENGLQFRAEAPVEHDQGAVSIRFTFSPFAEMETVADIIWIDAESKTGGLQFRDLPEASRANIGRWLEQNALPLPPRAESAPEIKVVNDIGSEPILAGADEFALTALAGDDGSRAGASAPSSEFAAPWRPPAGARFNPGDAPRSGVRTAVTVILCLVFVGVTGLAAYIYWRTGGDTQALGKVLSNWRWDSQSDAQTSPTANAISPLLLPPSKNRRARPVVSGREAALRWSSGTGPGEAELNTGLQYLGGDGGQAETAVAVKWLWASEKKGNMRAAMLLADLYAWGRGVPQNCEQARVLLIAASNRGSAEASQQLQDMEADGCASAEAR
ncbi:MAG: PilZ domain-containing protein [Candidatus Acidiferrales bacterium]